MHVERTPAEVFDKFPLTPIVLHPFDPASKQAALVYGTWLTERLTATGVTAALYGSVELEIAGKGEWEFALYPTDDQWYPTLILLINLFKSVYTMDDEFVLFNDRQDEHPIEIIVMRRGTAECNQAIMRYWRENAAARADYAAEKERHCHTKRDYYRWKESYIADILEAL